MRKKWLSAGAVVGLGAVMLFASGYSVMANTSGYEAYKSAFTHTQGADSVASHVVWSLSDNGTKVLSGTADMKVNQAKQAMSMTAAVDDGTQSHTVQSYSQDGKMIWKSGDSAVYQVMDQAPQWQHDGKAARMPQAAEQVIEALMGNIKDLATVETGSDGTQEAELHLSGSQIPAVVNAVGSLIASKAGNADGWNHGAEFQGHLPAGKADWKVNLPKLTDEIKVEQVDLDAKIGKNAALENQSAEIRFTGKDAAGAAHVLTFQLNAGFSGYNATTPDRVDLAGKQTEQVENQWERNGWKHH
ncbi:hypothetical protein [Paenibacillus sp. XY044]|uniref:hypothetical protein n=1 Tax=Paenibacillus sp. XY044 TaxID=2026089 RepID=UPI00117C7148|nr:hypothetical protein [Paenibacillus sp. XY044]